MAHVYHAVDPTEGVTLVVALKIPRQHIVMDDTAKATFLAEARLVALMGSHPNIVNVSRVGVDDGLPYMAMEYITGIDLAKLCEAMREAKEQWSEEAILWVLASIIQGLKHAWGVVVRGKPLRIVHRDITPSNIMMTYEGYVKIGDFGIAQQVGQDNSGSVRGKCRYMPVEQLQGRATTTSDMYAVGAIAWELIEGKRFRGDKKTEEEMLLAAFNGERSEITRSDISSELAEFVLELLHPNEKSRIQNPIDAWAHLKMCTGVNLVDPEPVQILLRDSLGQRRSGCTDGHIVVVHPELAATRAALAAAAQNKDTHKGQREADAPHLRRRAPTPPTTVKLESDAVPAEHTATIVLPEPTFLTPLPPAALARPLVAAGHGTARVTPPAPTLLARIPAAQPAQPAPAGAPTQSSLPNATLPLETAPPAVRHRKSQWLAVGLASIVVAVLFSAPRLLTAFAAHDAKDDPIAPHPATSQQQPEASTQQAPPPPPHTTPIIPTAPPALSISDPTAHSDSTRAGVRNDPPPSSGEIRSEIEAHLSTLGAEASEPRKAPSEDTEPKASTTNLKPTTPEPRASPKPKNKPRATVLVRLGIVGSLDLRIGSKVRHITGNTTISLRAGSKTLAVRRHDTESWYSITKRFDPGKEYLLRLYATRLDLIQLSEGAEK